MRKGHIYLGKKIHLYKVKPNYSYIFCFIALFAHQHGKSTIISSGHIFRVPSLGHFLISHSIKEESCGCDLTNSVGLRESDAQASEMDRDPYG